MTIKKIINNAFGIFDDPENEEKEKLSCTSTCSKTVLLSKESLLVLSSSSSSGQAVRQSVEFQSACRRLCSTHQPRNMVLIWELSCKVTSSFRTVLTNPVSVMLLGRTVLAHIGDISKWTFPNGHFVLEAAKKKKKKKKKREERAAGLKSKGAAGARRTRG